MIKQLKINRIEKVEFNESALLEENWGNLDADQITVDHYWSGEKAPLERSMTVRLISDKQGLYIRFWCQQNEPLVINKNSLFDRKTIGLWDKDVCEIFIAPNQRVSHNYFEFEAAPTGEWVDLAIRQLPNERITDKYYKSGMKVISIRKQNYIVMSMKIPWTAFNKIPQAGDVWLGNIFRCIGKDESRGYLAWSATLTDVPNFHVPSSFGQFIFL